MLIMSFSFIFQASHATVAQVACDSLLLLCDKADVLLELYPNVPSKIIQVCPVFKIQFPKLGRE